MLLAIIKCEEADSFYFDVNFFTIETFIIHNNSDRNPSNIICSDTNIEGHLIAGFSCNIPSALFQFLFLKATLH